MTASYNTVPLQTVVDTISELSGVSYTDLTTSEQGSLIFFINERVEQAWRKYAWPQLVETEMRYFGRGKYLNGVTAHDVFDLMFDKNGDSSVSTDGNEYVRVTSKITTAPVATEGTLELLESDFDKYLLFDQDSKSISVTYTSSIGIPLITTASATSVEVGDRVTLTDSTSTGFAGTYEVTEVVSTTSFRVSVTAGFVTGTGTMIFDNQVMDRVMKVYEKNPLIYNNQRNIKYSLAADRFHIYMDSGTSINSVYVQFIATPPTFSTSDLTAGVPKVLKSFIIRSAYSDYLRSKGQHQKAIAEESIASSWLDREYDDLVYRQGHEQGEIGIRMQ